MGFKHFEFCDLAKFSGIPFLVRASVWNLGIQLFGYRIIKSIPVKNRILRTTSLNLSGGM